MRRACAAAAAARSMAQTPCTRGGAAAAALSTTTSAPASAADAPPEAPRPPPPPPPPLPMPPLPPGAAWLRSLVDHERQGLPDGAGVVGAGPGGGSDAAFDPGPVRRLLAAMTGTGRALSPGARAPPTPGAASSTAAAAAATPLSSLPTPYRVAHIAGTKGKGSVAAMLSAALRASGLRVGTYTSPHLLSASERAVVGGGGTRQDGGGGGAPTSPSSARPRPISEDETERLAQAAHAATFALPESDRARLTHFEATTAMALRWFADQAADAAVVECGVGGATDATNVFCGAAVAAAVLTPVGHDHLAALGGSVAAAARAKAGILKRGRPVVVAEQTDGEAAAALREAVSRSGAAPAFFLGGGGGDGGDGGDGGILRVEAAGPVELLPISAPVFPSPAGPVKLRHLASQPVRVVLSREVSEGGSGGGGGGGDKQDAPSALCGERGLALLRELEAQTRASPIRMRLVGAHQRANAGAAIAAAALMADQAGVPGSGGGGNGSSSTSDDPLARIGAAAVARGLAEAFLPGRFQVLGLAPAGPEAASASAGERKRYLILDCAHTPESAAALARTTRAALASASAPAGGESGPDDSPLPASDADWAPVVLVLAMADDKPHRDVAAQLLYRLRPRAVVFTSVPIAGGRARAASATTLAAQWQAAAMLPPPPADDSEKLDEDGSPRQARGGVNARPPRCREFIQASLKAALQKARRELETALAIEGGGGGGGGGGGNGGGGGGNGGGVGAIVVAGSNHVVAAALRDMGVEDIVEQLE